MNRRKVLLRLARLGVFIALALIMHFLEGLLPPLLPFAPGAKMGLSNVVVLCALLLLGYTDALVVQIFKCVLGSIFSNPFSIVFSAPAGLISLGIMMLMFRLLSSRVSIMAISFAGAFFHNLTQSLVAAILNSNVSILGILPLMLAASLIAGAFVGIVCFLLVKRLPRSLYL